MIVRASLLAVGLICVGTIAHAQSTCHQRAKIVTELGRKYLEAPIAYGLSSSGQIIEVLTSGTGSWTLIVTSTDGVSCALASGNAWSKLPTAKPTTPHYIF